MRHLASLALACGLLCGLAEGSPSEDTFCVKVQRLYSGDAAYYEDAVLYVREGKVAAIFHQDQLDHRDSVRVWGRTRDDATTLSLPPEVPILDRTDLVAAPGFVLAQLEVGSGTREESTASARFRALDAFDPYAHHRKLLSAGITTAFLHPGRGRLVTGEGAVVKLGSWGAAARTLRARAELCVELGERALRPPPKVEIPIPSSSDVPIVPGERQRPTSRLTLLNELQAKLRDALTYQEARRLKGHDERPEFDPDLEALADAFLDGRVRIDARRADELEAAVAFVRAAKLRPVLSGGTEIYRLLEQVKSAQLTVVYEMPERLHGTGLETGAALDRIRPRLDTPRRLAEAKITFALAPAPGGEADLRLLAALAVRGGLSQSQALQAITNDAATVLGVGDHVGSLAPGKDADFVLLTDTPLRSSSTVVETWVDGRRVYRAPGRDALVVRAGTILTAAGEPIRDGEVLIRDGSIAAVGSSVPHPPGARVIDAGARGVVTPGFIDGYGHLGYQTDKGSADPNIPLHRAIASSNDELLRVALGGVTTVVTAPWKIGPRGARLTAIKTAESKDASQDLRRGLVLRPTVGMAYDLSSSDPLILSGAFRAALSKGKAYAEKWKKHEAELKKWRAAQGKAEAKVVAEREKKKAAKKEEPEEKKAEGKPEEKKPEDTPDAPKPVEEKKHDPISGTWSFTLSGGPLREPQEGQLLIKLEDDGSTISGIARRRGLPGDLPVTGSISGTSVTLVLQAPSPFGPPKVLAELTGEDQMRGSIKLGPFTIQFEATRTERDVPEIRLQFRRRSKGGEPTPPPVDESLEPLRAVFEGRGALVIRVGSPAGARAVVQHLAQVELPAVLLGFKDADLVAADLRQANTGLLLRPEGMVLRAGRPASPAAEVEQLGLELGFYSDAAGAAAELPLRGLVAVEAGVSQARALRALTIDAARLFRIDDRVGSLEAGKDGDLLVFDGSPFEATSRLRAVVVGGHVVQEEVE